MEFDRLLNHGMSPDHQLDLSLLNALIKVLFFCTLDAAGQKGHLRSQRLHPAMEIEVMLFCQNLCGGHNGSLIAALNHVETGQKGDHGLPTSHVSLNQSVHGVGPSQIPPDLVPCPLLSPGELEREEVQ